MNSRLCLLGGFHLEVGGVRCRNPNPKKARLLFAYLALHPSRTMERQALANLLWENTDAARALFNLRQALSTLRREAPELASFLRADDRRTLRLDTDELSVDAIEFRSLSKSAPKEAVSLYSGPLLAGMDEDWILPVRADLEQLYLDALESIADASDPREAVVWLRKSVDVRPLSEPAQQRLMIRLAESGDFPGLTIAYRRYHDLLHREIHAVPSADTERLYRRLLERTTASGNDDPPPAPVSHRLPVPETTLFGRDSQIAEVRRLLQDSRVVTLLGPGGVGKTRLAIAVGEEALNDYPAGVWFVDLSPVSDPNLVPQTIGQAIGVRERPDREWTDLLIGAFSGPPRLLILDNCEQVVEACAETVERLAARCDNLSILATSRTPLGGGREQRFAVEPLVLPAAMTSTKEWEEYSAVAMFVSRARKTDPRFLVDTSSLESVVQICRHVDGLPLGIEIAAAKLSAFSLEDVAARMSRNLDFAKSPSRRAVARHQSLTAVIEWSYALLSEPDRSLLRKLSVFSGGWTTELLESAFGADALESLFRLVETSLVQFRGHRYSLFESVRQFALDQLVSENEEQDARDRQLAAISKAYDRVRESWHGPDAGNAAIRYEADLDNARAGLDWSIASGATEEGLFLVANAAIVMGMLGLDASPWLTRLLAIVVPDPRSPARVAALRTACWAYGSAGYDVSRVKARRRTLAVIEEFTEAARANQDPMQLGLALSWLGCILLPSEPGRAHAVLSEAEELTRRTEDLATLTFVITSQAWLAAYRGLYPESELHAERALVLARERSDTNMIAGVKTCQGFVDRERQLYARARTRFEEARSHAREGRSDYVVRMASQLLAELSIDSGEFDLLARELDDAKPLARLHADWLGAEQVELMTRYLAAQQGRYAEATLGISVLIGNFVSRAAELPFPEYRWAGLGLEILAISLAATGHREKAARVLGAAQSVIGRDTCVVSASIRGRWDRPALGAFGAEIEAGGGLELDEAVRLAGELEQLVR